VNLLLFIFTIAVSFIVVRIGAIAFQLTGLAWSLAKFQALSCFTGTGFTTKESELITSNHQRRRIASVLMVLGHAGLVTLIATFANSLRPVTSMPGLTVSFLDRLIPLGLRPGINLIVIILIIYTAYKIFTYSGLGVKLTDFLRAHIVKKEIVSPVSFEELLIATGGYGVSSIEVCKDSPMLNRTLLESKLRQLDITVLAVERKGQTMTNPSASTKIVLGDKLICFGKLQRIRKELCLVPNN